MYLRMHATVSTFNAWIMKKLLEKTKEHNGIHVKQTNQNREIDSRQQGEFSVVQVLEWVSYYVLDFI